MAGIITRRELIAGVAAGGSSIALSAWTGPTYNPFFQNNVLSAGEWLAYRVQRLIEGNALAQEFPEREMSPVFRTNGSTDPGTAEYAKLAEGQFADWRLRIDGLVVSPASFSLAELQAMPSRTQITRHDCVEGWSAIGKWTGVQLGRLLKQVGLMPNARFIVFHCADRIRRDPLLREHRPCGRVSPPDAAGLRDERSASRDRSRRPVATARRETARLQASEVRHARGGRSRVGGNRRRRGRILGRRGRLLLVCRRLRDDLSSQGRRDQNRIHASCSGRWLARTFLDINAGGHACGRRKR